MDLSLWLRQELNRRGWTETDLARQTELPVTVVAAVLQTQEPPDFEFCYRVARALDKQPERLLHMAGLLSDAGLKLALDLAMSTAPAAEDIRRRAVDLSPDERRMLLACLEQQPSLSAGASEVQLTPDEFNSTERTQDRVRFALLVLLLVLLMVGFSLLLGLILVAL